LERDDWCVVTFGCPEGPRRRDVIDKQTKWLLFPFVLYILLSSVWMTSHHVIAENEELWGALWGVWIWILTLVGISLRRPKLLRVLPIYSFLAPKFKVFLLPCWISSLLQANFGPISPLQITAKKGPSKEDLGIIHWGRIIQVILYLCFIVVTVAYGCKRLSPDFFRFKLYSISM